MPSAAREAQLRSLPRRDAAARRRGRRRPARPARRLAHRRRPAGPPFRGDRHGRGRRPRRPDRGRRRGRGPPPRPACDLAGGRRPDLDPRDQALSETISSWRPRSTAWRLNGRRWPAPPAQPTPPGPARAPPPPRRGTRRAPAAARCAGTRPSRPRDDPAPQVVDHRRRRLRRVDRIDDQPLGLREQADRLVRGRRRDRVAGPTYSSWTTASSGAKVRSSPSSRAPSLAVRATALRTPSAYPPGDTPTISYGAEYMRWPSSSPPCVPPEPDET